VLIKLVQRTMLDVATSVDKLDFSRLNGSDDWEVVTVGNGPGECLACVRWEPAERYLLQVGETAIGIYHHDLIIPTLIGQLKRLEGLPGPQPTIYVSAGYNA
jgi:hypothetical protein